jgi:uncharacterized protein
MEVSMMAPHVNVPERELSAFCRRSGIKRLSLFGSVLTERFSDTSDVDVLVEFERGRQVGYLRMAAMERELSKLFGGRKIDLRTPGELSKYFRDEVMRTAAVQYANQ